MTLEEGLFQSERIFIYSLILLYRLPQNHEEIHLITDTLCPNSYIFVLINVFIDLITWLVIHMKKILDSDWLRAVQFKCNTGAKV